MTPLFPQQVVHLRQRQVRQMLYRNLLPLSVRRLLPRFVSS